MVGSPRICETTSGTPNAATAQRTLRSRSDPQTRRRFVCLSDCLFVCLILCLSDCLFVCLSVCLFVCLFVCLTVRLLVCLSVRLPVCWSDNACLRCCACLLQIATELRQREPPPPPPPDGMVAATYWCIPQPACAVLRWTKRHDGCDQADRSQTCACQACRRRYRSPATAPPERGMRLHGLARCMGSKYTTSTPTLQPACDGLVH